MKLLLSACLVGTFALGVSCFSLGQTPPPATNAAPAASAPGPLHADRIDLLKTRIVQVLSSFDARIARPDGDPTVRDLPSAALAKLALNHDPAEAEDLMRHLFKLQEMDSASPRYGSFPWQENHPEIDDSNSDEFCLMPTGAVFMRFGDKLSDSFKAEALPHLRAGIAALDRRNVGPQYTNIYLMKVASLLLVGEAINDPAAVQEAKVMLDTWIAFTRQNGLYEYDSSTYTPVAIGDLSTAYNFTKQDDIKPKLKACIDFIWTDIAANCFPGTQTLSGPQSRYYDFLFGDENIVQLYYLAGLGDRIPGDILMSDAVRIWTNAALAGYAPDDSIMALTQLPERVVRQRFGLLPGRDRYNYITPDFSIGSASTFYGNQDNQVSISLKSAKKLPFIEFTADTNDAPYGKIKVAEKSGHMKPRKAPDLIAAVQDKNVLMALVDYGGMQGKDKPSNLATNLLFPTQADSVYLDDQKISTDKPFDLAAGPASTLFVREGNAAVALRIFQADGAEGQQPSLALKFDGNKWNAGRLVAYHYRGSPAALKQPIRAGFFIIAKACPDDQSFQQFSREVMALKPVEKNENGVWTVDLSYGETALEAGLDLAKKVIATRLVNGHEVVPAVLTVNDTDENATLLGSLPTPLAPPAANPEVVATPTPGK